MRSVLIVLSCGLAVAGCGSGVPYAESSRTEARVAGRVTAAGKPLTKGQVIFDPANINRRSEPARTGAIGKDGTYEVTTLIGSNRVSVAVPGTSRKKRAGGPDIQQVYEVRIRGQPV